MPRLATAMSPADAGAADAGAVRSADAGAASSDGARRGKPRKWHNRRPAARRVELTPEEAERRDAERRAKLRTKALHVQLTQAEKTEITARANKTGNRVSDYARLVLLDPLKAPALPARDPAADRALAFQLSKIGTNLNQLAHIANETRALPHLAEFRALAAEIKAALAKVAA
jgi:Bacterial mobilisation protein (MobC)